MSGRIIFLIAGILFIQSALAQKNYLPAKIFTFSGDTVNGYIDYRNWGNNPYKVSFRTSPESEALVYKPFDIKGFSVKGELYVSAHIERETSPIKTGELNYDPKLQLEKDAVFLQTLIQGPKSLYYFKTLQENKDQFYIQQDSQFRLLIFKKYLKEIETVDKTQQVITENKTYIGQLRLYLTGCPSIQSKLKTVKYAVKDFKKLFQYYYDCTNTQMDFEKKAEKVNVELGVLLGASVTNINFESVSNVYQFLVNSEFEPSTYFTAAFFADIVFPRNQRKFSIENELFFNRYYFTAEYTETVNENQYTVYKTKIGVAYIKLNNMFRFKYPLGKVFIFINGGMTFPVMTHRQTAAIPVVAIILPR
ncbi:MAG: hypothetical protein GXO86_15035 [Chlorobi bacterium]|nr:hypothetical protein [Chlorobiota bacterium]